MKFIERVIFKINSNSFYWNVVGLIPYGQTALLLLYEFYKRLQEGISPQIKIIKFLFKYKILGI